MNAFIDNLFCQSMHFLFIINEKWENNFNPMEIERSFLLIKKT
jgi:hypothetical protein